MSRLVFLLAVLMGAICSRGEDWPMWQGNPRRTGCVDGQPGPKANPAVAWCLTPRGEQFLASVAVAADRVVVGSLGPLGPGFLRCLSARDGTVHWQLPDANRPGSDPGTVRALPMVSAPTVAGSLIVIGEGMHQHTRTQLRGVSLDDGAIRWALTVDSHLEGGATIAGGRVYVGAGAAGVLCLDPTRVVISGKAVAAVADLKVAGDYAALLDKPTDVITANAAWAVEFARQGQLAAAEDLPPPELPRPQPLVIWQTGAGQLHVDSAVAVTEGVVIANSALIEDENAGTRAIVGLDAQTGRQVWSTATDFNPWGPPASRSKGIWMVGSSSIRFDLGAVSRARGAVLAVDVANAGKVTVRPMMGGVLASPVTSDDGMTVFVAGTDGKVLALNAGGDWAVRWSLDCQAPLFATPALVDGVLYVADTKAVVRAVSADDGKVLWSLDLTGGQGGGVIYGSPVVAGGRLYVPVAGERGGLFCIMGR